MLPIHSRKSDILETVRRNQVTIVVGETGSGKTTQIPAFLYEDGYTDSGRKIGVTQPRRIAATSVAEFVAKQLGTELGDKVGFKVRFEKETNSETEVVFMTDGILLQEIQFDTELSKYSVVVVDEAHERSENIDFLLGLLKSLLYRRPDLKLVVTSATIDEQKFSDYFGGAPVVNVSGRTYPVDIVYSQTTPIFEQLYEEVAKKVADIHITMPEGDILVFMTGREDIEKTREELEKIQLENLIVLPIYGEMPMTDQKKIFDQYPGKRKVVIATNIAETSITVEGIVYVVDGGFVKQSNFHPENGIKSLDVTSHSQAGCNQRAGRAGRVRPGICYRMYTTHNFDMRQRFTTPEILRVSLTDVVLKMENIGINDVENFDFIDPPNAEAFKEAYETLVTLGAIKRGKKGLTDIGLSMAKLPLEARISRMVLEAVRYGCTKQVATVAAFLSSRNIYNRPKDMEMEARIAHEQFRDVNSDALTFLNIWDGFEASGFSQSWCFRNFLNFKAMVEIGKVRNQIFDILSKSNITLTEAMDKDLVAKAVVSGLLYNMFIHRDRGAFVCATRPFQGYINIHPSSSLFNSFSTRLIVVAEIARTTRVWGRVCTKVRPEWLADLMPGLCEVSERITFWLPGEPLAEVEIVVNLKGNPIESTRKMVSIEEARKIQEREIARAEAKGCLKLTFRESVPSKSHFTQKYLAWHKGTPHYTYDGFDFKIGATYMCKVDNFLSEKHAYRVFQVFEFPKPEVAKVGQNVPFKATVTLGSQLSLQTVKSKSATAVEVGEAGGHFTEMGSRWFRCSCGSSDRVSKEDWKRYLDGDSITIECPRCFKSGTVRK